MALVSKALLPWAPRRDACCPPLNPAFQVVAFYPGVLYRPLHHRSIPGYPMVATDNEFLLSRLDGAALDGKPWGLGRLGPGRWPPHPPQNRAEQVLAQLEVRARVWGGGRGPPCGTGGEGDDAHGRKGG